MLDQHAAAFRGASRHRSARSGGGAQPLEVDPAGERIVHRILHQLALASPLGHQCLGLVSDRAPAVEADPRRMHAVRAAHHPVSRRTKGCSTRRAHALLTSGLHTSEHAGLLLLPLLERARQLLRPDAHGFVSGWPCRWRREECGNPGGGNGGGTLGMVGYKQDLIL